MTKEKRASVYFDRIRNEFAGIDDQLLVQLATAYPRVNISEELAKMACWLKSPKGSKRKGNMAFVMNWLAHQQPSTNYPALKQYKIPQSLVGLYNDYDEELWKNCTHLLEMNTRHS